MKGAQNYRQRAIECIAFARSAQDQQERIRLLIMANMLESLAHAKEQKPASPAIENRDRNSSFAGDARPGAEE